MALGGDVEEFDGLEAFFLEAVREDGLGVGEVEVFFAGDEDVAAVGLRHFDEVVVWEVAEAEGLFAVEGRDVGVKIDAHAADRGGEDVGITNAEHAGDAGAAGEAGDDDAAGIDVGELSDVEVRVDGEAHAVEDAAWIAGFMSADEDELLFGQNGLPLGRDGRFVAGADPDEEAVRITLAVVFRQEDVEELFFHVVGRWRLGGTEAEFDLQRFGMRRGLGEGDLAANAGFRQFFLRDDLGGKSQNEQEEGHDCFLSLESTSSPAAADSSAGAIFSAMRKMTRMSSTVTRETTA